MHATIHISESITRHAFFQQTNYLKGILHGQAVVNRWKSIVRLRKLASIEACNVVSEDDQTLIRFVVPWLPIALYLNIVLYHEVSHVGTHPCCQISVEMLITNGWKQIIEYPGRNAFLQKIVQKNQSKISHVGRGDSKCVKISSNVNNFKC